MRRTVAAMVLLGLGPNGCPATLERASDSPDGLTCSAVR
jgi:hypothetical protein